ncbi:mitR domain protein [Mycobacterium xenopi 3993]|nr:mitR domain protein [Mycobacterium xenopi 3993]
MHALDGALADVAPAPRPFLAKAVSVGAVVRRDIRRASATRWLDVAHQAVQPYSVGGYVNYLEANQPRRGTSARI